MFHSRSLYHLIASVTHAYPRRTTMLLALGLCKGTTEGLALLLLLPILALFGIGSGTGNTVVATVRDMLGLVGLPFNLTTGLSLVIGVGFLSALVSFAQAALLAGLTRSFVRDLQIDTYGRLLEADTFYLVQRRAGESLGMLMKFAEQAGNAVTIILRAVTDIILVGTLLALAIWQSAAYVGFVALLAAIVAWPLVWHFRRVARLVAASHGQVREMTGTLGDHLKMAFTIKAFGAQKKSRQMVGDEISRSAQMLRHISVQIAFARAFIEPTLLLFLCITIWFGIEVVGVSTDRLLLLVLIFLRLTPRLIALSTYTQQGAGLINAYAQLLEMQRGATEVTLTKGTLLPEWRRLTQSIRIDGVGVERNGDALLSDVTFDIPSSGITAVVGPSGAGKSTLTAVVLGLVEPTRGRVLVEDTDLSSVHGDLWRQRLGFVGQDNPLFHTSIRENLNFARQDASESTMLAALESAGLGDFVRSLPKGLDTVVGEGGGRISGGERQRLALARALLRQPLLLILDEPTSALDWITADQLFATIRERASEIPVLLVTHDLHLASRADRSYLLENGTLKKTDAWLTSPQYEARSQAFGNCRSSVQQIRD